MALTGELARAQDLDRGKSGAQLFATNCMDCHHSPKGLAQDRFSWTLSFFLQQHYTSSPASAQALTAYLQSVDARRPKPQPAVHNWRAPEIGASASPPRPPAPVPVR
jgi:mono/diheme cytochrome c family protein